MNTTTYTISIPPKFWYDHADRCVEREVPTTRKGKRIIVELTGDEVADLHSDAIHYSKASDFDMSDALAMASSARATRKAVEAQVANLDELAEQWSINAEAARQAYLASDEYKAKMAMLDEWKATQARLRDDARQRDIYDPTLLNMRGLMIRHEQKGDEWVTVRGTCRRQSRYYTVETNRGTVWIDDDRSNVRASEVGIEVAVII
jgi:hypothetical protein